MGKDPSSNSNGSCDSPHGLESTNYCLANGAAVQKTAKMLPMQFKEKQQLLQWWLLLDPATLKLASREDRDH